MDVIKIGLDFGTHQTKICVQRTPDEGHGEPNYEFFQFPDLQGKEQYFLPSVIQINKDDTLSYGYVNPNLLKPESEQPVKQDVVLEEEFDVAELAESLYDKYATSQNSPDDMHVLGSMLQYACKRLWPEILSDVRKQNVFMMPNSETTVRLLIYSGTSNRRPS